MKEIIEIPEKFKILEWSDGSYTSFHLQYRDKKGALYGTYGGHSSIIRKFKKLSELEEEETKGQVEREYRNVPSAGFVVTEIYSDIIIIHDPRGFNISVDHYWFSSHILPKVTIDKGVIQEDMIYCMSDCGCDLILAVYGEEVERNIITKLSDLKKDSIYMSRGNKELMYLGRLNNRAFEFWQKQMSHYFLQLNDGVIKSFIHFPDYYYGKIEYSRAASESEKETAERAVNEYKQYYRSTAPTDRAVGIRLLASEEVIERGEQKSYYSFYKYLPSGRVLEARNCIYFRRGKKISDWSYYVYAIKEGWVVVEQITSYFIKWPDCYNKKVMCSKEDIRVIKDEWENSEKKTLYDMSGWVYRENSDFMIEMEDGRTLINTNKDIVI